MSLLDTQGAFIIGGLLMLNILGLNLNLSRSHHELSSGYVSQRAADELIAVMRDDFSKIGHRVIGEAPIKLFNSTRITFLADLGDDGSVDKIEYSLSDTTAPAQTSNPHDRFLYRTINNAPQQGIALGVVAFKLIGYDNRGNETMAVDTIRTIEIVLEVEATDPIGETYNRSIRRAKVSPISLGF